MLATTGADGQLAVWDLALERDPEEEAALAPESNALAPDNLPPQLLFVHGGQQDMKEVHWHPQARGRTAAGLPGLLGWRGRLAVAAAPTLARAPRPTAHLI